MIIDMFLFQVHPVALNERTIIISPGSTQLESDLYCITNSLPTLLSV